jgi:hypothetical protein
MKRPPVRAFLLALAAMCAVPPVSATPPLERRAKAAGYPATDCTYCHSFSMDHMTKKALEMKIPPMNCYACHGKNLPRSGKALFNARGQYLVDERRSRQVDDVDVAWLKAYVEASPAPVSAKR